MRTVIQDLRYAIRALRKKPVFTAGVVLSLALAIGANTAIFSLIDSILLRPLPVKQPDQLVSLYTFDKKGASYRPTSYPDYLNYRDQSGTYTDLAAYLRLPLNLSGNDLTERVSGEVVTPNYFSVLGVDAVIGRTFLPEETSPQSAQPVALVSYNLWQRRFAGDPDLVGRTITLNRQPVTVVGILPQKFKGATLDWTEPPDVWVPMTVLAQVAPPLQKMLEGRQMRSLLVIGRLNPETTMAQAQAATQTFSAALEQTHPVENRDLTAVLLPANRANFWPAYRESMTRILTLFAVAVGSVLLLACTNVANLLLERAVARRKEIAIRLSVGATRSRLVRQLLTESVLLSLLSVAFALFVSYGVGRILLAFPQPFGIPLALDLTPDARTIAYTFLLSLLTAVLFGLVPALQALKPDLVATLKDTGAAVKTHTGVLRQALVVIQVAIATVLLIGGGLFVRSLLKAYSSNLGFRYENLLLLSLDLGTQGYSREQGKIFYRNTAERMRLIPGVQSASLSSLAPLSPIHMTMDVLPEGAANDTSAQPLKSDYNLISPQYFLTVGIPFQSGRDFNEHDTEGAPAVTIINQTLAARLWPHSDPIGRRLFTQDRQGRPVPLQVVGVVKDAKYQNVWEQSQPYLYLPLLQDYTSSVNLALRTAGAPGSFTAAVRGELRKMDANLPVFGIKTGAEQTNTSLSKQRLGAVLLAIFGILALLLAAVGLYSVMAYSVAQRTQEIGIRMALGATPSNVIKQVMRQGMSPALAGIAVGLGLALILTKFFSSQIPGVTTTDLLTYLLVSLLLAIVALMATYVPARKASRVDPLLAIKHE